MPILVVVAHPDDEILGAGGSIHRFVSEGAEAHCLVMSGEVAWDHRPDLDTLKADVERAAAIVGFRSVTLGPFPTIAFNTQPHLDLVQFVEQGMGRSGADVVITHHPVDSNDDHRHTAMAALAASRLHQRGHVATPLRGVFFMEVLSSTDWSFPGVARGFEPSAFVEIGERGLQAKLAALGAYRGVMRDYPHPRSTEVIRGLATVRGGQAGMDLAEAFQVAHLALTLEGLGAR